MREFVREPEALFWAFIFPIVMSVALAIAFPGQDDRPVIVDVQDDPAADDVREALDAVDGIDIQNVPTPSQAAAIRNWLRVRCGRATTCCRR
jgi:ABC-2 type transport system permease protein